MVNGKRLRILIDFAVHVISKTFILNSLMSHNVCKCLMDIKHLYTFLKRHKFDLFFGLPLGVCVLICNDANREYPETCVSKEHEY